MREWSAVYGDGTVLPSRDGAAPSSIPVHGIQALVHSTDDEAAVILTGFDWYWWRDDEAMWYGGDLHGFLDQAAFLGAQWPKQGRTLLNGPYRDVMALAIAERDRIASWAR